MLLFSCIVSGKKFVGKIRVEKIELFNGILLISSSCLPSIQKRKNISTFCYVMITLMSSPYFLYLYVIPEHEIQK